VASNNDRSPEQRQATEEQRGQKVASELPDGIARGQRPGAGTSTGPRIPPTMPQVTEMLPTEQESSATQPRPQTESTQ
jgi:hypothetical protein